MMEIKQGETTQDFNKDVVVKMEPGVKFCHRAFDDVLSLLKEEEQFSDEDTVHTSDEEGLLSETDSNDVNANFYDVGHLKRDVNGCDTYEQKEECGDFKYETYKRSSSPDEIDEKPTPRSSVINQARQIKMENMAFDTCTTSVTSEDSRNRVSDKVCGKENVRHYCTMCGKSFTRKYTLIKHVEKKHTETTESRSSQRMSVQLKKAVHRNSKASAASNPQDVKREVENSEKDAQNVKVKNGISCVCLVCGKHFSSMDDLDVHSKVHDDGDHRSILDDETHEYECHVCRKVLTTELNFRLHLEIHEGTQKCHCDQCGARFSRKTDFVRHMYIHTGEAPYKCLLCQKAFKRPGDLNRHRSWHNGKNTCKYCGKRLVRDVEYRRHVLDHEKNLNITDGFAKFECKTCGVVLNSSLALTNHIRKEHACVKKNECVKKRTFPCPHCDLVSSTASNRARHIQRQHGTGSDAVCDEKGTISFPCQHCRLQFPTAGALTRHGRNQHHQDGAECGQCGLTFRCDICGLMFNSPYNMSEHIQKVHFKKGKHICAVCNREFYKKIDLKRHKEKAHRLSD